MVPRINPFGKGKEETKEKETVPGQKILSAGGSPSETLPFEQVEIHVEGEAVKEIPKIPVGAFGDGEAEREQEGEVAGGIPEDIDLESLKALINSGVNIPALYCGTWFIRTQEQTDLFATELYYYCEKKGINLRDWIFDEFGLLLAAINLAGGIYGDYKEFKKNEAKKKEEENEE